ncbi:MAG: cysteine hydrolase [Candidatus Dormiibacterota bacterium]
MYEIDGKRVYTELAELVEPSHTALIVIDMQKDFCSRDGSFAKQGLDLSAYESMVPRLAKLLDAARSFGVTVIHLQMTTLPGHRVESPAQIRFNMLQRPVGGTEPVSVVYTVEGTEGHQIIPELSPMASEFIVPKYRSSGFWGTNLDMILGSNGLETVIVTGCTTEGCVESTARDALFNDYYVVVAEDCVASDLPEQHEASLVLMRKRFDVATSDAICAAWQAR